LRLKIAIDYFQIGGKGKKGIRKKRGRGEREEEARFAFF